MYCIALLYHWLSRRGADQIFSIPNCPNIRRVPMKMKNTPAVREIIGRYLPSATTYVKALPYNVATSKNGIARPSEYTKSSSPPCSAVPEALAKRSMVPSTGPRHGLHPRANNIPSSSAEYGLPGRSIAGSCALPNSRGVGMMPSIIIPKKMTSTPPMEASIARCKIKNLPIVPDTVPKKMNMRENPMVKSSAFKKMLHLRLLTALSPASFFTPPARNPTYAGMSGSVQGARKVSMPPKKADMKLTLITYSL